jgi:type IV pilus assembly protein PilN
MIRINLLPVRAAQKKEKLRGQIVVVGLCGVVALLLCVGSYLHINMKIEAERAEVSRMESDISALKKKIGEVGRFKKLQEELKGKLEILDKLKSDRSGPARYLDELNKIIPEKLWLTEFTEKGGTVTVKGVALSEKNVAEFMRNLTTSQMFDKVDLVQTAQKDSQGLKLQDFQLTFVISYSQKEKS